MKPINLKSPYSGLSVRRPVIQDGVWYVPADFQRVADEPFHFPGWSDSTVFTQTQPIKLEYCSGNGAWIAAKAQEQRDVNWVAIERKFMRVRKIWSKTKNYQLNNLFIICAEGYGVTRHYLPSQSVDEIFINFPDPWPKKRHIKHRIIQKPFVDEIARLLRPTGRLTVVTDDTGFSDWTIHIMQQCEGFISCHPAPYFISDFAGYGTSYFEDLWRSQGKEIRYHQFERV